MLKVEFCMDPKAARAQPSLVHPNHSRWILRLLKCSGEPARRLLVSNFKFEMQTLIHSCSPLKGPSNEKFSVQASQRMKLDKRQLTGQCPCLFSSSRFHHKTTSQATKNGLHLFPPSIAGTAEEFRVTHLDRK